MDAKDIAMELMVKYIDKYRSPGDIREKDYEILRRDHGKDFADQVNDHYRKIFLNLSRFGLV